MERAIEEIINFDMTASAHEPVAKAVKQGLRAFQILRAGFTVIPIIAGSTSFFTFLWTGIIKCRRWSIE